MGFRKTVTMILMEASKEDPHIKNRLLDSMGEFKAGMI